MGDAVAIYQLHVQSADKLDERRDLSTRAYGGMSVVVTAAAAAGLDALPFLSVILWTLLCVVAVAWLATLDALTAKLKAKNLLLAQMEERGDVPITFLTQERQVWGDPPDVATRQGLAIQPMDLSFAWRRRSTRHFRLRSLAVLLSCAVTERYRYRC